MQTLYTNQQAILKYKEIYYRRVNKFLETGDGNSLQLVLFAYDFINAAKFSINPRRGTSTHTLKRQMSIRLTRQYTQTLSNTSQRAA